jgi:hypothetical protein
MWFGSSSDAIDQTFLKGIVTISGERTASFEIPVRKGMRDTAGWEILKGGKYLIFMSQDKFGFVIDGEASGVIPYDNGVEVYGVFLNDQAIAEFVRRSEAAHINCSI